MNFLNRAITRKQFIFGSLSLILMAVFSDSLKKGIFSKSLPQNSYGHHLYGGSKKV